MSPARAKFLVLCCIDPRFRTALEQFVQKKFGIQPAEYDLKTDAGGVREISCHSAAGAWMLKNIDIAVHKHGVTQIVFCNHIDCSYYGGNEAYDGIRDQVVEYTQDMKGAAEAILSRHPEVKIFGYVAAKEGQQFVFEPVHL